MHCNRRINTRPVITKDLNNSVIVSENISKSEVQFDSALFVDKIQAIIIVRVSLVCTQTADLQVIIYIDKTKKSKYREKFSHQIKTGFNFGPT